MTAPAPFVRTFGTAARSVSARDLAGGAQGRAPSLDEGKADSAGKGWLARAHTAPATSVLKAGP